jgi:hypothetical protein
MPWLVAWTRTRDGIEAIQWWPSMDGIISEVVVSPTGGERDRPDVRTAIEKGKPENWILRPISSTS